MASIGTLNAKAVLDYGGFIGDAKKMADQYKAIVGRMAKEANVPVTQFQNQIRGIRAGLGRDVFAQIREEQSMAREAQRSIAGIQSSILNKDDIYNGLYGATRAKGSVPKGEADAKTLFQQAEQLERYSKVFTGVRAGLAAAQVITAAWKKDWEGVQDAIDTLPFGIGQTTHMVSELRREWSGINEEVERNKRAVEGRSVIQTAIKAASDDARNQRRSIQRLKEESEREVNGFARVGIAKVLYDAEAENQQKISALQDERTAKLEAMKEEASKAAAALRQIPQSIEKTIDLTSRGPSAYAASFSSKTVSIANPQYAAANAEYQKLLAIQDKTAKELIAKETFANNIAIAKRESILREAAYAEGQTLQQIREQEGVTQLEIQGRFNDARIQAILDAGRQAAEAERHAGRIRAAAAIENQAELAAKLETQRQAIAQREANEEFDKRRAATVEDLNSQLAAKSLAATRQTLKAQLAEIQGQYRRQIRQAEDEGDFRAAKRLRDLQRLDQATAIKDYYTRTSYGQGFAEIGAGETGRGGDAAFAANGGAGFSEQVQTLLNEQLERLDAIVANTAKPTEGIAAK